MMKQAWKRIGSVLLIAAMLLTMLPAAVLAADSTSFTDVAGHWAEDSIERWGDRGVINGNGDGAFKPDNTLSRAEMMQMLAKMLQLTEKADISAYTDVAADAWYADAVAMCLAAGIVNGTSATTMSPEVDVTREQAFTMFARALAIAPEATAEVTFADSAEISSYAAGYINALANAGWINGTGDNMADPKAPITRASFVTIMDRAVGVYAVEDDAQVTASADAITLVVGDDVTVTGGGATVVVAGDRCRLRSGDYGQVAVLSDDTTVTVDSGAKVDTMTINGSDVTVNGSGEVTDAVVNGDNNAVNTKGTTVTASEDATGTTAGGKAVAGGESVTVPETTTGGGSGGGGGSVTPSENKAQKAVENAWEQLNTALAEITGNDGAALVTATYEGNKYALTLDVDAIQAGSEALDGPILDGLATKIKEALDATFGTYALSVDGEDVYVNGTFQNTQLKNALFSVADGFFYYLSNMQPVDGVYTYKTVNASAKGSDSYSFTIDVQLKGDDVDKVRSLAKTLADHLQMEVLDAETIYSRYGVTVAENQAAVITMEMPSALMDKAAEVAASVAGDRDLQDVFDAQTVGEYLALMQQITLDDMLDSGVDGINSVLTTVNSNKALINKVLSKLKVTVDGENFFDGAFVPGTSGDAWQNFVSGVNGMTSDDVKAMTPTRFKVKEGQYKDVYYAVPVTVNIDLADSMGFTAEETVVVVLHIDFGPYEAPTETNP